MTTAGPLQSRCYRYFAVPLLWVPAFRGNDAPEAAKSKILTLKRP